MNRFEGEMKEWFLNVQDIGNVGYNLAESTQDTQKTKLSFQITKEILLQCKVINESFTELTKTMLALDEYIEDEVSDIQKVKRMRR